MIELSKQQLGDLAAIYAVANTPLFLYRHLRQHSTVMGLAEKYSAQELAQTIDGIDDSAERDLTKVVTAYAVAVALTFKPTVEADAEIETLHIDNLEWIDTIFQIWRQTRIT